MTAEEVERRFAAATAGLEDPEVIDLDGEEDVDGKETDLEAETETLPEPDTSVRDVVVWRSEVVEDNEVLEVGFVCKCPECKATQCDLFPSRHPPVPDDPKDFRHAKGAPRTGPAQLRIPNAKKGGQKRETVGGETPRKRMRTKTTPPTPFKLMQATPKMKGKQAKGAAKQKTKESNATSDDIKKPVRIETRSAGSKRVPEAYILDSKNEGKYILGCSANRATNFHDLMQECLEKIEADEIITKSEAQSWLQQRLSPV